jgi:hypothetical protein
MAKNEWLSTVRESFMLKPDIGIPRTSLGVRMHGVTLTLAANHQPLLDYAASHLNGLVAKPAGKPDLAVQCVWSEGEWDAKANPFATRDALNVIGKRMLGNAEELVWLDTLRMKGLQLRFRRKSPFGNEPGQCLFDVAYSFHPKAEKLENLPEYEYKKYFSLMSYLVYYPLIWYLENYRRWAVLHASALASPYGGIMIGGLGGVGKTTTCVALMQHAGFKLLAENLIFTDGEFIYPCSEPIRLDEHSLAMLGAHPPGLAQMAFPEGLKDKWLFQLEAHKDAEKARPVALFLPHFSSRRSLTQIAPELAVEKIMAMNRLTRELDDYGWYAAALEMAWPQASHARNRLDVLHRFTEQTLCFELGIDRSAGVEAVVEDVLRAIHATEFIL